MRGLGMRVAAFAFVAAAACAAGSDGAAAGAPAAPALRAATPLAHGKAQKQKQKQKQDSAAAATPPPEDKDVLPYLIMVGVLGFLCVAGTGFCVWRNRVADQVRDDLRAAIQEERRATTARTLALPSCAFGTNGLEDAPAHMICPLAMHVMSDPVVCVDGHHTFDRPYLLRALELHPECPYSREPMTDADVTPDAKLAYEILTWVKQKQAASPDAGITIPEDVRARILKAHENTAPDVDVVVSTAPLTTPSDGPFVTTAQCKDGGAKYTPDNLEP
eukprot:TRINITY_DN1570_c0_g1_i1.p1 TRINITY_DN1570_c0_g1~~TRINITY_DN1570_c0_g1_i1.p1  ORF type:complete len:275 (+),score=58.43 TRINITY_DN1570_c0_g1_i1:76-900(+)